MSTLAFSHLDASQHASLNLPIQDRVNHIQTERWVAYTAATNLLERLEQLLAQPKSRRSNLLIVAAPGNGKTTVIDHFRERNPAQSPVRADPFLPVLAFDMPPDPSEGRFWNAVLRAMSVSFREGDNSVKKESLALDCLRALKVRVLVIDEFHNALHGNPKQTRQFLATLKNLINALAIPIVAAGTKEAVIALNSDPQMTSRFDVTTLPKWELNSEFLRLLVTFERLIPLAEPSGFKSREMATKIFQFSGGTIGGVSDLLRRAAVIAVRRGEEKITPSLLDEARRHSADAFTEQLRNV